MRENDDQEMRERKPLGFIALNRVIRNIKLKNRIYQLCNQTIQFLSFWNNKYKRKENPIWSNLLITVQSLQFNILIFFCNLLARYFVPWCSLHNFGIITRRNKSFWLRHHTAIPHFWQNRYHSRRVKKISFSDEFGIIEKNLCNFAITQ